MQGRLYNLLMLTTTHLRRERPAFFEEAAADVPGGSGDDGEGGREIAGEGARGGEYRAGLLDDRVGGSPVREATDGNTSEAFLEGVRAGMGVGAGVGGASDRVGIEVDERGKDDSGVNLAFSRLPPSPPPPLPPLPRSTSPLASAAAHRGYGESDPESRGDSGDDSSSDGSAERTSSSAYFRGKSILTDGRIWLAHFER